MKTKSMIAIVIAMVLLGAMTVVAKERPSKEVMEKVAEIQRHLKEKRKDAKMWTDVSDTSFDMRKAPQCQEAAESDEPMVTINCKFVWDEEEYPELEPHFVAVQSADWKYYGIGHPENDEDWTVSVLAPKGKECYVIGLFNDFYSECAVVKTIKADEEKDIVFNAAEADQEIIFKPLLKDGEPLTINLYTYDEEYNEILVEKGSVNEAWFNTHIQIKNSYGLTSKTGKYERILFDGNIYDTMDYISFRTNNNDLLYFSCCIKGFSEEQGVYSIKLSGDCNSGILSNSPNDYITCDREYGGSLWEVPTSNEFFPKVNPSKNCGFGISTNWIFSKSSGTSLTSFSGIEKYPTNKIYLSAPSPKGNDFLEMAANPISILYTDIDKFGRQTKYGISSPSIMIINDKPFNIASHNFILEQDYEGIGCLLREQPGYFSYPYNPSFSYPLKNNFNEKFGDNTPITQFTVSTDNRLTYSFVGRYSEARSIDFMNHNVKLYHRGEEIAGSWKEIQNLTQEKWWYEPIEPGLFKLEIENANMTVDGIQGCNSFVTEYDNSVENFTFPALEILQFRNNDDEVTDRFGNGEEGILSFAAGALLYRTEGYDTWYEYEPLQEVKVEYAPNGTDSFKDFMVEEDPDKFYMPGYGAYYYGSLGHVEGNSENGWFDVRITLVDSFGNYQQQTVSPAFKIENSVGIPTVEEGNSNVVVRVVGRNIIAPADAIIMNASRIITDGKNAASGVYIISLPDGKTQKVMVK